MTKKEVALNQLDKLTDRLYTDAMLTGNPLVESYLNELTTTIVEIYHIVDGIKETKKGKK